MAEVIFPRCRMMARQTFGADSDYAKDAFWGGDMGRWSWYYVMRRYMALADLKGVYEAVLADMQACRAQDDVPVGVMEEMARFLVDYARPMQDDYDDAYDDLVKEAIKAAQPLLTKAALADADDQAA